MDSTIRRFEREAVIACLIFAAARAGLASGGASARRVLGGRGALAALSYLALKGVRQYVDSGAKPRVWPLVKFFTRYAILAFVAYVMLARLRLRPVGSDCRSDLDRRGGGCRGVSNDRVVLSVRKFPLARRWKSCTTNSG